MQFNTMYNSWQWINNNQLTSTAGSICLSFLKLIHVQKKKQLVSLQPSSVGFPLLVDKGNPTQDGCKETKLQYVLVFPQVMQSLFQQHTVSTKHQEVMKVAMSLTSNTKVNHWLGCL